MHREKMITHPTRTCRTAEYLLHFVFDRFKHTLMPLIRTEGEKRGRERWERLQGERQRWREGDRQSCLSFLRWNRLSSLSSPLLTWPQFKKKENSSERWRGEGESALLGEETHSLLTSLHISMVVHKHKFRNLNKKTLILYSVCDCDLQCITHVTTTLSRAKSTANHL